MTEQSQSSFRCIVSADLFRRAALCVSTDETRYYLMGVHVEPCPEGGALLVATAGHSLICLRDPEGIVEGGSAIVLLNRDLLRAAKKPRLPWSGIQHDPRAFSVIVANNRAAIATWKSSDVATPEADAWPLVDRPNDRVAAFQWAQTLINGTYPNWRATFGGEPDASTPAAPTNMRILSTLVEALASDEWRSHRVFAMRSKKYPNPGDGPHLVKVHSKIQGFGIIMPSRPEIDAVMPTWWTEQPAPAVAESEVAS